MLRAALYTLLVAIVLTASLQAQRAGSSFHGSFTRSPMPSGSVRQRGSLTANSGHFLHSPHRSNPYGSSFLSYGDLWADEPTGAGPAVNGDVSANNDLSPATIPALREARLHKAQFIEIPAGANSPAARIPPPAVFILANGERLETRRFVLSASALSVSIDRRQRTVPLEMLDLYATINANHERGIDLRIPNDRNEISLSF